MWARKRPTGFWLLGCLAASGCYQGEWRLGSPVPVSATARLHPVRTVETWEMRVTGNGNAVEVRGTTTERCRLAAIGKASRTDVGTFERVGGNWWKGAAIVSGIAGGAGVGIGLGGTLTLSDPKYGAPIAYGAGGALAAGGVASCLAAISRGTKVRYSLCGILTGFGASVLVGGLLGTLPGSSTMPTAGTGSTTTTTSPALAATMIDAPTFQKITIAGGALVGVSVLSGIIGHAWQGTEDRSRTVDVGQTAIWDDQQPESACSGGEPLRNRRAALLIATESLTNGLGSGEKPLRVAVQPVGPGPHLSDLFWFRQALPHCGLLTVRVVPDVAYVPYTDDFVPVAEPSHIKQAVRPRYTQLLPADGVSLLPLPSTHKMRPLPNEQVLFGYTQEQLRGIDERCQTQAPSPRPLLPAATVPLSDTPNLAADGKNTPHVGGDRGAPSAEEENDLTPGIVLTAPTEDAAMDVECGREVQKNRFKDCEHQCARNLGVAACLSEYRVCAVAARGKGFPLRERSLCDAAFRDCVAQKQISPSSFRACTEACADANVPTSCRTRLLRP